MHKWFQYVALLALILSGCSKQTSTPAPNTVTFSFPASDHPYYLALVNEFYAQNAGVTVKLDPVPDNKLSEQRGDVRVLTWDIAGDQPAWSADEFIDLQPILAEDSEANADDFYPGLLLPFTHVDKLAALPYGMDLDVLYYNQDIYEKQEIPLPNTAFTWDSFLDAAARLTARDQGIFGYTASTDYLDSLYFLYQNGGSLLNEDGVPALDTQANVQALSWYGRLFTTLNVAPTIEQAQRSFGFSNNVFASGVSAGRVGMWPGAFSDRGISPSTGAALEFKYGIVILPRGLQNSTSGVIEAYAISNKTKNPDACWSLVKFLSFKTNPRLIPARPSIANGLDYAKAVGAEAAEVAKISAGHIITVRNDQMDEFLKAKQAFLTAVSTVLKLEATAAQALEAAQESIAP